MAKAIYALKIFLFREQFNLTVTENKGITDLCLFVSLVYGKFWHEAPLAIRAPFSDLRLISALNKYMSTQASVATVALKALYRHLWYLAEDLVGLAIFDPRVDSAVKVRMVQNLKLPAREIHVKRLDAKCFTADTPIESLVTSRTANVFSLLVLDGKEKAEVFLTQDPGLWSTNSVYCQFQDRARDMKVVNDCAERGVALITSYNSSITKNEEKQFLLHAVDIHQKAIPTALKHNIKTK
jgi:hypothetical protein